MAQAFGCREPSRGAGKGQASLELLLILAALFAFAVALAPVFSSSMRKARSAVVDNAQALALAQIAGAVREAEILGAGNSFAVRVRFPADSTTLAFDGSQGVLSMNYSFASQSRQLNERFGFPLSLAQPQKVFPRGSFDVEIAFEKNAVGISLSPAKPQE